MHGLDVTTGVIGHHQRPPTRDLWDDALRWGAQVPSTATDTLIRRSSHWTVPAALTAVLAAVGLGRPGLWTDELATWGMATTPWSEFWPVLRYVDAVLAPYYVFMHGWVSVFGDSDLALRAPSLLAMVGAAAMIGVLGNRLAGHAPGLLGGIVFAVLPSTSRFAAEVRPYALVTLLACVSTWLVLRACERPTLGRWLLYGVALTALGWLHVVALLLMLAHATVLLAWHRRLWWHFTAAASLAVAAATPIVRFGLLQQHQVAYIAPVGFATTIPYLQVLFGTVAVGAIVAALALFSLPLRFPTGVFTAWAVAVPLGLVLVSLWTPMFLPRYLLFTTPAWALLAGTALARLRVRSAVPAIAIVAALTVPAQVQLRAPGGHGEATEQIATVLQGQVQPGDAVVYADTEPEGGWTTRDAVAHYVPANQRPRDALATNPPRHNGLLLATECVDVNACLVGVERVWLVRLGALDDPIDGVGSSIAPGVIASKEQVLRQQFQVVRIWYPAGLSVALLQRLPQQP